MREVGERARAAARALARASTHAKDCALDAIAAAIRRDEAKLLAANAKDVIGARATGNDAAFVDRLTLKLLNNRILTESDFYSTGGSRSVFLRRESLGKYFPFYNEQRIHQALDYRTPQNVHFATP